MAPQFYLTQPAIQNIEAIADYIAGQTGLQQAERFLSKLDAKFARITQFPNLGRPRDEILSELRSLSMESYLILHTAIETKKIDMLLDRLAEIVNKPEQFNPLQDLKIEYEGIPKLIGISKRASR